MAHDLKCHQCGKPFQGKRRDAKYCSSTCRTYACRNPKENRKGKSLSGLTVAPVVKQTTPLPAKVVPAPEVVKPNEPKKLSFADMPPLRLYEHKQNKANGNLPPAPEPPELFTDTRPDEILPDSRIEDRTKPNPEYDSLIEQDKGIEARAGHYRLSLAFEQKKLQDIRESKNVGAGGYVGGAAAGGLLAHELFDGGFWATFFGVAAGFGAVRLYDGVTEEQFNAEKQKQIIAQSQVVNAIKGKLSELYGAKLAVDAKRSVTPKLLSYKVRVTTNHRSVELRKQEIEQYEQRKVEYDQQVQAYEQAMHEYREKFGELLMQSNEPDETTAPLVDDPTIISGAQLMQGRGDGSLLFQGKWKSFIGEPSRTFLIAIHGPSGSGKSHLAVQFGYYLNVLHGTVLYVSGEEGHSDTMTRKLSKYADVTKMNGYDFADITTKEELFKIVAPNKYNFIILDSINNMRIDADDLRDIVARYSCSGIIAICQNTKKGEIRGSYEVVHDADVKIRVEEGIAYTDKNRYIDDKPELDVFNIGPVPSVPKVLEPKIIPLNPTALETMQPKKKDESNPTDGSDLDDQEPFDLGIDWSKV